MSLDHKPWGEEMIYLKFEVAEYNQISTDLIRYCCLWFLEAVNLKFLVGLHSQT